MARRAAETAKGNHAETAEQRQERLRKRRARDRARCATQTAHDREACLRVRRDRLALLKLLKRETRLQQMRTYRHMRLATESDDGLSVQKL